MLSKSPKSVMIWLLRVLGIFLAFGLMAYTILKTDAKPFDAIKESNKFLITCAFLCIGSTHFLGAFRWGRLLSVQGIHLKYSLLLKLTLVGVYFSMLIPGAVSGDLLKLAYVARTREGRGTQTFLTIAMDRIVGVAGLFLVADLGGILFAATHWDLVTSNSVIGTSLLVVILGGLASLAALAMVIWNDVFLKIPFIAKILNVLDKHLPKAITDLVKKLADSANLYKSSRKTVITALLISMLIHTTLGIGLFCIGRAIGETSLSFAAYFLSTQIGNAVTLVPATPGGLGLRDAVSAAFFAAFQTAPTSIIGTIPIVNSILIVTWAMFGAICLGFLDERRN